MKKKFSENIPRQLKRVQPRFVILISLVLLAIFFLSAIYELNQTKREIQLLMQGEAGALMEAISVSGANAIEAFVEIENLVEDKLFAVAHSVDALDQQQPVTGDQLTKIAAANGVFRINIFNKNGKKIISNVDDKHASQLDEHAYVKAILDGMVDELVIGFKESRHPGENRFAVAVKRTRGGVIVTNVDAAEMLEFRKTVGVGRLMQDIGKYEGIEYLVLQDYDGIILASKGVSQMTSISSEDFLTDAIENRQISSRLVEYHNQEVFEFVRPFYLKDELTGLLRIGLKTEHLNQASNRIKQRIILMSVVLGFVILIIVNFFAISQNYRVVNEAYQRIQTYSQNILEHMADAVVAIDKDKRITMFNRAAAQLFKPKRRNVIDQPCEEIISADIIPLYDALAGKGTVHDWEHRIRIDDKWITLSISTSIIENEAGEIESAFAVMKDLTEKRRLEEIVNRQEKLTAMGQLASGVAHEIRNPLNSIGMITQRFAKEFVPKEDAEEYYQLSKTVVKEVRRINEIIQQFLQFARPPKLNLTENNINELIEEIVILAKAQAQTKEIEFSVKLGKLPAAMVDQNQLKQALLNLLQNSVEAIEKKGRILIETSITIQQQILIDLKDTGKGIETEKLSKIFNLYFTTKPTGTGLGLSIVHQIISQHNGRIEVESEVGKGTRFRVLLPVPKMS